MSRPLSTLEQFFEKDSKYAPEHSDSFEELVRRLRQTEEWRYVDREVDIRLSRP